MLSRGGLELTEIWHRQRQLVESEDRNRALERQWKETGHPDDADAWHRGMVRAGRGHVAETAILGPLVKRAHTALRKHIEDHTSVHRQVDKDRRDNPSQYKQFMEPHFDELPPHQYMGDIFNHGDARDHYLSRSPVRARRYKKLIAAHEEARAAVHSRAEQLGLKLDSGYNTVRDKS